MTTILLCLCAFTLGYLARSWRIDHIKAEADRLTNLAAKHVDEANKKAAKHVNEARDLAERAFEDLASETHAHALTKAHVAGLEADLIEAGREASTHAGHLEALLDATREPALRLVKGSER